MPKVIADVSAALHRAMQEQQLEVITTEGCGCDSCVDYRDSLNAVYNGWYTRFVAEVLQCSSVDKAAAMVHNLNNEYMYKETYGMERFHLNYNNHLSSILHKAAQYMYM